MPTPEPHLVTVLARVATAFERIASAAERYQQQQAENQAELHAILARLQENRRSESIGRDGNHRDA